MNSQTNIFKENKFVFHLTKQLIVLKFELKKNAMQIEPLLNVHKENSKILTKIFKRKFEITNKNFHNNFRIL